MKLKFMTYNIASGRCYDGEKPADGSQFKPKYDLSRCISVIKANKPDFLGLNEITENDRRFGYVSQPGEIAKACGFPHYYFGKAISFSWIPDGAYGNAQCSDLPFVSTSTVHIPDPEKHDEEQYYEHRAIIKNVIELEDGRRICVMQVHCGLAISEHQNAIMQLCHEIDTAEYPVILMGDFNMRPWDFLIEKIRACLVDACKVTGNEYITTFPSSHVLTDVDQKIDYIFVSPSIKVLETGIIDDTASDHRALWAVLDI